MIKLILCYGILSVESLVIKNDYLETAGPQCCHESVSMIFEPAITEFLTAR